MAKGQKFNFEISLSVLNHLGRNLYRNFITVIGEAISNAWDADAENVWIYIDRDNDYFAIVDDGWGMSADDFQSKFLRIGYSKRAEGHTESTLNRPFIGAKGIGKLALLSCADQISVFSKEIDGEFSGGKINNAGLNEAIKSDLTPDSYELEPLDFDLLNGLGDGLECGTVIVFEGASERLRNSVEQIRKLIALSFRFALLDESFSIFVNDEEVGLEDIEDLLNATEFCWSINEHSDEFTRSFTNLARPIENLQTTLRVTGFIASVVRPRDLKIRGTEQRASVDLFVNGRLREKNILRHIPSQRVVESYLYGQLHFDSMDSSLTDPFTTSREGVVENDPNFQSLLDYLKRDALSKIFDQWDKFRLDRGEGGDEDNKRKSKQERKALDLYSASLEEYRTGDSAASDTVEEWLDSLKGDAEFNFVAYADCFLSENLLRRHIDHNSIKLVDGVQKQAKKWRDREQKKLGEANISFVIRENDEDIDYLGMDALAVTVEGGKSDSNTQSLCRDAKDYAPVRNVVGHTGRLTEDAKTHLRQVFKNVRARVKRLLSEIGES